MSDRAAPWFGRVLWELIKRQPLRYAVAQVLWISIWSMQILVGLIIAWYFDALTAGITTSQLGWVVAAMLAYAAGRSVVIFLGMRNHASLLFRAGGSHPLVDGGLARAVSRPSLVDIACRRRADHHQIAGGTDLTHSPQESISQHLW